MATCGAPSGPPAWLIGWQITRRQPSRLGCLRVETTLPSTRASNMDLIDSEVIHPHTAPHAGEGFWIGPAFAGRRSDRVAQVAFASQPKPGHTCAILYEKRRVQRSSH